MSPLEAGIVIAALFFPVAGVCGFLMAVASWHDAKRMAAEREQWRRAVDGQLTREVE